MDTLRVGLIGCGRHGTEVLLGTLGRTPHVQISALVDIDPHALQAAARRAPGAVCFESSAALFEHAALDAVVIATSNRSHVEIATQAFKRGLHVYLEKPLGVTCAETLPLIAAWRASRRVGMIGFNYRRNPFYAQMAQAIADGAIGKPQAVQTIFCNSSLRPIPEWKQRLASGGGACLDLGTHHVDLLMHLLGARVEQVAASFSSVRSEADSAALTLRFASGVTAQVFVSFHALRQDRVEVIGTHGALAVDRYQSFNVQRYPAEVEYAWPKRIGGRVAAFLRAPGLPTRLRHPTFERSYDAALRVFAGAVRGGGPHPSPGLLDGYRTLQVIEAAHAAARSGQFERVPADVP